MTSTCISVLDGHPAVRIAGRDGVLGAEIRTLLYGHDRCLRKGRGVGEENRG